MANKIHFRDALGKIFKPRAAKTTNGFNNVVSMAYEPNFSRFGSNTLYSTIVYSAVQMKARYFGKLEPRHIRNEGGKITSINDSSIAKVLRNPNHYQTTYDFLAQAYFMRRKDRTCYIYADYDKTNGGEKKLNGLYVLLPNAKPILREDANGLYYLFSFDGYSDYVEFDFNEIIPWKDNIEDQQYMGGGKYDANANIDLYSSLEAYHEIKEAIKEAAKLGCMFDGYLKINGYTNETFGKQNQEIRDKFVEDIRTAKGKIPVLDNGADYQELKRQLKMVDAATLKEIKENALISEGITIDVLTGKMTIQDKEAFYESHIEPAAISLGQAISKVLFSQWQTSHGDQIILYPHKVQLMATSEIVSIIQSTISAGVFMIDEYREMLGYAPLPNGEGEQRPRGFNNLDGANNNGGGATE